MPTGSCEGVCGAGGLDGYDDKPASLAVDLHIYGESVHKTVQFYKRLRDLSVKAGLRSGGNFKKTNPHWKQFGLGWDPGHVYLRR